MLVFVVFYVFIYYFFQDVCWVEYCCNKCSLGRLCTSEWSDYLYPLRWWSTRRPVQCQGWCQRHRLWQVKYIFCVVPELILCRLIVKFGSSYITPNIIARIEALTQVIHPLFILSILFVFIYYYIFLKLCLIISFSPSVRRMYFFGGISSFHTGTDVTHYLSFYSLRDLEFILDSVEKKIPFYLYTVYLVSIIDLISHFGILSLLTFNLPYDFFISFRLVFTIFY